MRRIAIRPFEGLGGLVVVAQITHDFCFEVEAGFENAAGNHIALELTKPEFDLIEPGRISGGVMECDLRMAH